MSKICITLDCPMADILSKNDDGNFDCSRCQKTVYDFTGMSKEEFEKRFRILKVKIFVEIIDWIKWTPIPI